MRSEYQRAVSKPAARLGVPAVLLLVGSGLLGSGSTWAQAPDIAPPTPSWESCLTERDVDQRVSRYKASVEQYRQQVAELEQELSVAHRLAEKKLDAAPPSCEPPQSILEELSNVRSALAVRNEELKRLQSRLQLAESGDDNSTGWTLISTSTSTSLRRAASARCQNSCRLVWRTTERGERKKTWLDTDKDSRTERLHDCCHRKVQT